MNQSMVKEFGNIVCKLREKRGFTQQTLSKKLKISQSLISRIEVGKARISLPILFNLSKALDKNPDRLIYLLRNKIYNRTKRKN